LEKKIVEKKEKIASILELKEERRKGAGRARQGICSPCF
jgi:hypothetical protein